MKPMLAGVLDPADLDSVLTDDNWWAQQKLDGDRVLFQVEDGTVTALNRNGEIRVNLVPRKLFAQFERMPGSWVFDGELMSDGTYWLFDLPQAHVHISPTDPYRYRQIVLERFFAGWAPDSCIRLLPTARTTEAKTKLIEATLAGNGEGVIFKDTAAPYRPGKRSPSMLKAKFTKTVDCVVTEIGRDGRANCHVALFEGGQLVEVGSVATAGKPRLHVGDVLEVRYLYASDDRRLYQPVYVRVRADKAAVDCTIDQLRFTNREVVPLDEPPLGLVRQRRRSRFCGVLVEIHDTWHPRSFLGDDGGRWVTLCVAHGQTKAHGTFRLAQRRAARPDVWCAECREQASTALSHIQQAQSEVHV